MSVAKTVVGYFTPFAILLTMFVVATSTPAEARGTDVVRTGACSGSAHWKLKVKPDDGRLEVEAEIDSNRAGQAWAWSLRQNGTLVAHGSSTTQGRSGSIEVRRLRPSHGSDAFVLYARRPATGQTCRGTLSL